MIWLGALGTLLLFVLQLAGIISVSVLVILTPLLIGIGIWLLFLLLALIVLSIGT